MGKKKKKEASVDGDSVYSMFAAQKAFIEANKKKEAEQEAKRSKQKAATAAAIKKKQEKEKAKAKKKAEATARDVKKQKAEQKKYSEDMAKHLEGEGRYKIKLLIRNCKIQINGLKKKIRKSKESQRNCHDKSYGYGKPVKKNCQEAHRRQIIRNKEAIIDVKEQIQGHKDRMSDLPPRTKRPKPPAK
jgi:hypothetical protein